MNRKALGFVISGMLATEEEKTLERLGYILNTIVGVDDLLCDGVITDVKITHIEDVKEYVKKTDKTHNIIDVVNVCVSKSDEFNFSLSVCYTRTVYRKEGGKDWEVREQKSDEYIVEGKQKCTFSIPIALNSVIPGVSILKV